MNNWKIIPIILITALISLGAGYLLFSDKSAGVAQTKKATPSTPAEKIWTCSMHPQIRQSEPGNCPLCGMDLIPLDEAKASGNPFIMEMTPEAVKLANIQTVAVGSSTDPGAKSIALTGKIQADERLASNQVAHVPGRIEQLFITFTGERIRKGQKLVTIYSPELVRAQSELIEASKWKASGPQLLEAVRNKLRYWKIPDATIEQIESSGEVQANITIYADRSGIVQKRRVAVGDYVKEGEVLFDIANLSRLWVLFDAYEEDLAKVRVGDNVSFTLPAIPGQTFEARISFIDPLINPQTRVAALRAEIANPGGLLKPEMFVRGTVQSGVKADNNVRSIPKTAVLWTGTRSVVYVEKPKANIPSYEFREVTLGDASGNHYKILAGLEPGERVVVNGAFVIDAAAQLNNMASMMNRNVQQTGVVPPTPDYRDQISVAFQDQLRNVVQQYLLLKDELVNTDAQKAAETAKQLLAALKRLEMRDLKGEAHQYWMEKQKALQEHSQGIRGSTDIAIQRKQFGFLSIALIETISAFGVTDSKLYLQHCPMAFDNAGMDWLSKDKQIRNPYFGDKMMRCGITKDSFLAQE